MLGILRRPSRAHASRSRKAVRPTFPSILSCEELEQRTLLSFPPLPVVPSNGELSNLANALKFAQRGQTSSWDNQPIPFAVVGTNLTTGAVNTVKNNPNSNGGMRVDIDVDSNPNTGKGGKDISVGVSTELFLNGTLNPHLLAQFDRLGTAPFAQNFEILISFPFGAFAPEFFQTGTVQDPNLFIGYKTFSAASTGPDNGAGGIAPLSEQIRFIPNTMFGASHNLVQIQLATSGAANPLQFLTGYFDAAVGSGLAGIKNAGAYTAWAQNVPATIGIGVGVGNSFPLGSPFSGNVNLDWTSSSRTRVVFGYQEAENANNLNDPDFDTSITFDPIPNHENIALSINEGTKTFAITHNGFGQTINTIQVLSERNDGLTIIGTATDVPPNVQLSVDLDASGTVGVPAIKLDVTPLGAGAGAHVNTLDVKVEIMKTGGFLNTADFLGYNLGYVEVSGNNMPDLTAGYLAASDSFGVKATNPGESIGWVEVGIDDNAHYGRIIDGRVDINNDGVVNGSDDGVLDNRNVTDGRVDVDRDGDIDNDDDGIVNDIHVINGQFDVNNSGIVNTADDVASLLVDMATPPHYFDGLPGHAGTLHHIFSLVDDGAHGTAVARIVRVVEASLNLNATDISEAFTLNLAAPAAPMTAYINTKPTSNLISGHDVEVEADIENLPFGQTTFTMDPPFQLSYTTNPPQGIAFVHIFGHIDNTFFDLIAGNLPAVFSYNFDPDGSLSLFADDGDGVPEPNTPGDQVGLLGLVVHNAVDPQGLSGATADLFGAPIRDAAFRVNDIPSFHATWADNTAGTTVSFDTDQNDAFLGGAQVQVRTDYDPLDPLQHLPSADVHSAHYLTFTDDGANKKRLGAGVFGIDAFSYASVDAAATYAVHFDGDESRPLSIDFDSTFGGKFFPQWDVVVDAHVNDVPQQFDLNVDLDPSIVYTGSDAIDSVTLTGTIDDTNNSTDDGFDVTFAMLGLPSQVRIGIITGEVKIIDGKLDVNGDNAVNGSDDGQLAGVTVIDGALDLNASGGVNGSDDGAFVGIVVIDGLLDVDASGGVNGSDDGSVAGADVKANAGISEVGVHLESRTQGRGIFGKDYRLIQALVDGIPAQLVLSYGGDRFLFETKDASGNPDGVDEVSALVSTSKSTTDNNNKILPFTLDGPHESGPILGAGDITGGDAGGSRVHYSQYLQEIDKRYYNSGDDIIDPNGVLTRLAELYADSEQLDVGEDHLVVRKEDPDGSGGGDDTNGFISINFNDFQKAAWTPDEHGGQFVYRAPGRGNDPFFGGYESDDKFTSIQIEHVPDEITVDIDDREHVTYDANVSPGEIDFYQGPGDTTNGLFAGDSDEAMRGIIRNAPSDIRIFWSFTFPNGGAFFDASNEFEGLFLTQDGSTRITAGATMEDLHVGWGIDILSFDVTDSITIPNPIPFCPNLEIPTAWELFQFRAGIDNDADNVNLGNIGDPGQVAANDNKADVAGFFALYNMLDGGPDPDDSPFALDPAGPAGTAPGAAEYVPFITAQLEGFELFAMDFLVELDPLNPGADFFPIDLEFNIDTSKLGNLVLDIWSPDDTFFSDGDAIPFIPEVGFKNVPDYSNNSPIHILPGLFEDFIGNGLKGIHTAIPDTWVITFDGWHTFDEHFDPFSGTPAPFTGSSGDGGFDAGDVQFVVDALGPFSAALSQWEGVLDQAFIANGMSDDDAHAAATALVTDIANNTAIQTHDFSGAVLGDASGDSNGATIRIDPDAGGFEWFIDTTPFENSEFDGGGPPPADLTAASGGAADGKVDMVTFFFHEIGHILGLTHSNDGIMQATLPRSVRRIPVADDYTGNPLGGSSSDTDDVASLTVELLEDGELWWFGPF